MYGVGNAVSIASNEAIIADKTDFIYNVDDKLDKIVYSKVYWNKETKVDDLVVYLELNFTYNGSLLLEGMEKTKFPIDSKYK